MEGESRQVLCCCAKTWSLVIGWIQAVCSAILLAIVTVSLCLFVLGLNDKNGQDGYGVTIFGSLVEILAFVVGLIAGIILITGVKQENARKLKIWMVIEIVFLAFTVVSFITRFFSGAWGWILSDVITIALSVCCILIVNVHRHELLHAEIFSQDGVGHVRYGGKV